VGTGQVLEVAGRPIGRQLRQWREKRRMSQLQLAAQADVSARHLSFVETGRALPSRDMVLRLAEHLDVPLRDRNDLLLAAGFAPLYSRSSMEAPQMTAVRSAIAQVLAGQEPYPALVADQDWNLVDANKSLSLFTDGVASDLLEPPINVIRLALHPEGFASRILNLGEWRAHLLGRLRRRIALHGDERLTELYRELLAYPCDQPVPDLGRDGEHGIVVPLRLRHEGHDLAMFCTVAVFGSPLDVTVAELAIETFFPADAQTSRFLSRSAVSSGVLPLR
jgi:transcriptional regulator with XRE-family HTH domain